MNLIDDKTQKLIIDWNNGRTHELASNKLSQMAKEID